MLLHIGRNTPKDLSKWFNCSLVTYYRNKEKYFNLIAKFAECRWDKNNIIINSYINMPHKEQIDYNYRYDLSIDDNIFTEEEKSYYTQLKDADKVSTKLNDWDSEGLKIGNKYTKKELSNIDKTLVKIYKTDDNMYIIYEIELKTIENIINNNLNKTLEEILDLIKLDNKTFSELNLKPFVAMYYYKKKENSEWFLQTKKD